MDEILGQPADVQTPSLIVIFGITGDLAHRKLLPALYALAKQKLIHPKTRIIGITRRAYSVSKLLDSATPGIRARHTRINKVILKQLSAQLKMHTMSAVDGQDYLKLADYLDELEAKAGVCLRRLYYLAVPPQISAPIITNLGEQGLQHGCRKHKSPASLLLEKPFGFDLPTAQELIDVTTRYFKEPQIFRIDHYLAKETVQNIVTFRFRNPIFEDIWNNHHIKSIEIVADEQIDIEGRGNFYEQVGALRDIVQSHLLYIASIILMERPADITSSQDVHRARLNALQAIEPIPADKLAKRAVRGQYQGYRGEVDIPSSWVETFVALKLYSHDSSWRDVPIILRSGKALSTKQTKITVTFRPKLNDHDHTNQLIFNIQPDEGIVIELWAKKPGFARQLQRVPMSFSYKTSFNGQSPDAYEQVLVDAMRGDNMLFATSYEVLAAWRILEPLLNAWSVDGQSLQYYTKGSQGPSLKALES